MSTILKFRPASTLCWLQQTIRKCSVAQIHQVMRRGFADKVDTPKPDKTSKQIVVQGSENEAKMRVRRARSSDVPRVLKFVQEHARIAWPGIPPQPTSIAHIILNDYVARALAQGHTMLAEQLETRKGWAHIRGLALGASICSWDVCLLERWSKCVGCARSRKLLQFTATFLQEPGLHDKYQVNKLLQVLLMVPSDHPKCADIVMDLMKSSIKRGQEAGFPLVRIDVTNQFTARILEEMQLKKEWELNYDIETFDKAKIKNTLPNNDANKKEIKPHFIAVFSVPTKK